MKVYIAGPMRGIKDFNFPAFDRAETWLKAQNIEAINPAQHDRDGGFEGIGMTGHEPLTDREDFDLRETLKWDLEQVAHADAVAVLEGWERSSGARAEVALAHALGIPVALAQVARLYGAGAEKYEPWNWRKGYEWSKSYAALQRHATQFWAGEDTDTELGTPHLASVIFHAMTLLVFMDEQRSFDDRYSTVKGNAA